MGCCGSKPVPPPVNPTVHPPLSNLDYSKPAGTDSLPHSAPAHHEPVHVPPPVHHDPVPVHHDPAPVHHPPVEKPSEPAHHTLKPTKFECDNGHDLLWYTDLPFHYFTVSSNWTLRCSICQSLYSCAGWHCRSCNYDMCIKCAEHLGKKAPELKCSAGHTCTWAPESVFIYKEESDSDGFICNICRSYKYEPNWNCVMCSYDVCISCAIETKNIHPPIDYLMCSENHHLKYYKDIQSHISSEVQLVCDKCKTEITEGECFNCNDHSFDMCIKCAKKRMFRTIPHPGYQCNEGKKLKIEDIESIKEETGKDIKCDICLRDNMKWAYLCGDCLQCYCLTCSRSLSKKIEECHKEKCKQGHQLTWTLSSEEEINKLKCSTCSKSFSTGSFSCEDCNFNLCIKDMHLQDS